MICLSPGTAISTMDGDRPVEESQVEYIHFMCDGHEIVLSNGAWTETFQPGDISLGALGDARRNELFRLFPDLAQNGAAESFTAARRTLRRYEAQLLATA